MSPTAADSGRMHVCVLGGGVVGVATAYYLASSGYRVTVVERRAGVALDASFANGGQLSYSYVAPLAQPAVLRKLLGWLLDRDSALRFVPRLDMRQWRWALAFLRACRSSVARRTTEQLLALSLYSRSLMHELVRTHSIDFDYKRNGKLVVYRNWNELAAARRQMDFQASLGCEQQALDAAACVEIEPALAPLRSELAGGIYTRSEDVGDCHRFTAELARVTREKYGAEFRCSSEVQELRAVGDRIESVRTAQGDLQPDAVVVSLGMSSLQLLAPLGVTLPLYPLTGYSLTIPVESGHSAPHVSITDADQKVVYARLGDRLRVAGMIDITGMSESLDRRRLSLLQRQAHRTFPQGAITVARRVGAASGRPRRAASRCSA